MLRHAALGHYLNQDRAANWSHLKSAVVWVIPFLVMPLLAPYRDLLPWPTVLLLLATQAVIGCSIVQSLGLVSRFPAWLIGGVFHLVGGLTFGFISIVLPDERGLYLALAVSVLISLGVVVGNTGDAQACVKHEVKRWQVALALIPGVVMLFYGRVANDALYWFPVNHGHLDTWFFTGYVATISEVGLAGNLADSGAAIGYQWLAFSWPAAVARLTECTPHVALWGMYLPFLKVFCPLIVAWGAASSRIGEPANILGKHIVVGSYLYSTLSTINPQSLIGGDLAGVHWPGAPGIIPARPPECLATALFGVSLTLLARDGRRPVKAELIAVPVLLSLIAVTKLSMLPAFGGYLGCWALCRAYGSQDFRSLVSQLAGWCAGLLLVVQTVNVESSSLVPSLEWGGYVRDLVEPKFGVEGVAGLIVLLAVVAMWSGFRVVLLLVASFGPSRRRVRFDLLVGVLLVLLCLLPPLTLRLNALGPDGVVLRSVSHDLPQFLGAAILLMTILVIRNLDALMGSPWWPFWRWPTAIYCLMIGASLVAKSPVETEIPNDWVEIAARSIETLDPSEVGLLASNGTPECPASVIAARGGVQWWMTMTPGSSSGYWMNNRNYGRHEVWELMMQPGATSEALALMSIAGVTHLVATFDDIAFMNALAFEGKLRVEGPFLYRIL